jgi:hypothetical protein
MGSKHCKNVIIDKKHKSKKERLEASNHLRCHVR